MSDRHGARELGESDAARGPDHPGIPDEPSRTGGLSRFFPAERGLAFADAVIAIAMTLLILPLMESAGEIGHGRDAALEWFGEHWSQLFTFLLSFVLIGFFWIGHHRVFERVQRVTVPLLWLTLGFLLTIVWLPVATALTGYSDSGDTSTVLSYVLGVFAASAAWLLIRIYLARHPELHTLSPEQAREGVFHSAATALMFLFVGALMLLAPQIGYFAFFLMFLSGPAHRLGAHLSRIGADRRADERGVAGADGDDAAENGEAAAR